MEEVLSLISDARLLAAKKVYDKILESPEKCLESEHLIKENESKLATMVERCAHVDKAMSLVASENPDWTLATDYLGVRTHYMLTDDGLLWVRMESTQCDIPVMEQMAVVYEVEWFKRWIPFCNDSKLLARLSKNLYSALRNCHYSNTHFVFITYCTYRIIGHTELIAQVSISSPFAISRECVVYAYGVDCIYENGSLVVLGESVEAYDGIDIPPCKGMFNKRATLNFSAVVTPFSPTSGHVRHTYSCLFV